MVLASKILLFINENDLKLCNSFKDVITYGLVHTGECKPPIALTLEQ